MRGFLEYNGAVNDTPALETIGLILQGFPEGYKRSVVLAAADVETGEYVQYTEKNTPFSDLHQAAMCSASIPGVFPSQHFNGRYLMDGGTIWNINIDGAIKGCLEKGFAENEIILDISICFYDTVDQESDVSSHALNNWLENMHIHRFY